MAKIAKVKPNPRKTTISCGTLVYRNDSENWDDTEILLIKQFEDKDLWGIPKGHINKGETKERCAIRETREETGIDVDVIDRLPDVYVSYPNEDKTVISFIARQSCNKEPTHIHPDSEVADVKWFNVNNLPKIISYQQAIIHNGFQNMKKKLSLTAIVRAKIDDLLKEVYVWAPNEDSWLVIKKQLLSILHANERRVFSTRHPLTKKQRTNKFEREIAQRWSELTGRRVLFSNDE